MMEANETYLYPADRGRRCGVVADVVDDEIQDCGKPADLTYEYGDGLVLHVCFDHWDEIREREAQKMKAENGD